MCPVRVKFTWKPDKGHFARDGAFAIFHDHVLQKMDLSDLAEDQVEDARMLIRQTNKKIPASELAERFKIKPYEATMLIKTTPLMEFNVVAQQEMS